MKRSSVLTVCVALVWLVGCASKDPPPTPVGLKVPAVPEALPGSIRVYGDHLPPARVEDVRERLRDAEPSLLSEYQSYLHEFPGVEGRVQLRLGINPDGKIVEITRVYSEVSESLGGRLRPILERIDFGAGPAAYVYYTLEFRPDPLEVSSVATDFAATPPSLVAVVENHSAFHLPQVSVTVTVLGPEKAKPLRVYRRKVKIPFAPGERHEIRVPVGGEWATARNSFLVAVAPAAGAESARDGEPAATKEP